MSSERKKNIGIILAGGIGLRFDASKPKQYHLLCGKEIISYSIEAFKNSTNIDDFIVVLNEEEYNKKRIEKDYNVITIKGGKTRNESLNNAISYIKNSFPYCEKIIENNAACPMITSEIIDLYMSLLDEHDCITTAYSITDALGTYSKKIVNREDYYLIQSPDAYRFKEFCQYFDVNSKIIHPAHMFPKNRKEYLYFDFDNNIKITNPSDLIIAENIINSKKKVLSKKTSN